MPIYAKRCREAYEKTERNPTDKYEFVECVYRKSLRFARDEYLVQRGTKALIELTEPSNRGQFIHIDRIKGRSLIQEKQSASSGLWPWTDGAKRAGVIEKERGRSAYRIKDEFIEAMFQLYQKHLRGFTFVPKIPTS